MPEASSFSILENVDLVISIILSVVGFYFAHSLNQQLRVRVAERRLAAYAALWEKMVVATPVRLARWNAAPMTRGERQRLYLEFTEWYYKDGNGMLLEGNTRAIYLKAKDNLICPLHEFEPESVREKLERLSTEVREEACECARGYLSIRQLSLLRTRMKADLAVYGPAYHRRLNADDRAFLRACGENVNFKPWSSPAVLALAGEDEVEQGLDPYVDCRERWTKQLLNSQ